MRPLMLIGLLLIVVGLIAFAVPSVTFFTTERVADAGFFKIDVERPHTVVFNPFVGLVALIAGIALAVAGRHPSAI